MSPNVVLPIVAVAVLTAIVTAVIVSWPVGAALCRQASASPMKWAGLVLTPIVVAALVVIALVTPALIHGCHCMAHGPHHPHFCLAHPNLAAPLLLPAALILVVWSVLAAPGIWRVVLDGLATRSWLKAKKTGAWVSVDGVRVRITDCGAPIAVTTGVLKSQVVVDEKLWNELDPTQRLAIVHHEHAHALRRDTLTLLVLRAAAALALVPAARRLIDDWRTSAELESDQHASAVLGDPLAVASALISVERISAGNAMPAAIQTALAARPGETLERRVRALVDANGSVRARLRNDLFGVMGIAATLAVFTFAWPTDAVHHALETLIGWAVH